MDLLFVDFLVLIAVSFAAGALVAWIVLRIAFPHVDKLDLYDGNEADL